MNILQKIKNGQLFTLKIKPQITPRMRRLPRGMYCNINVWSPIIKYKLDLNRSTKQFLLFTSEGKQYNWWINSETMEVCYDASTWMQNHVEKDNISDFDFMFYA